jgi:hypothetical protein
MVYRMGIYREAVKPGKSIVAKSRPTAADFAANFPCFRVYLIINSKLNWGELRVVIVTAVVQNNPFITASR